MARVRLLRQEGCTALLQCGRKRVFGAAIPTRASTSHLPSIPRVALRRTALQVDPTRVGVLVGTGMGGLTVFQDGEWGAAWRGGGLGKLLSKILCGGVRHCV